MINSRPGADVLVDQGEKPKCCKSERFDAWIGYLLSPRQASGGRIVANEEIALSHYVLHERD